MRVRGVAVKDELAGGVSTARHRGRVPMLGLRLAPIVLLDRRRHERCARHLILFVRRPSLAAPPPLAGAAEWETSPPRGNNHRG